jgi:serine/threonine-protein kinase ATR
MSVLETFLHDPLCEWNRNNKKLTDAEDNPKAVKSLLAIDKKLQGYVSSSSSVESSLPLSVPGQVNLLINQATSLENLSRMYIGWAPYL